MTRVGIAALCGIVSCQAFYVPVMRSNMRISVLGHGLQKPCARSPRQVVLSMSDQSVDKTAAAAVEGGDASKVEGLEATNEDSQPKRPRFKQRKRRKRKWTPAEQAYLDKMADAPIIYKRIPEAEFYPSVGYESAFPTLEESLTEDYTGESTVVNEDGEEDILMRVVIVGAGEEEGRFVKALSEKGEGKLVGGMYLVWDPRVSEAYEELDKFLYVNVHELGTDKTRNPENVARHARFLKAHMLVAVKDQPGYPDDYTPRLKKAALESGITFVGPGLAADVSKGEMAAFTELVKATRAALAAAENSE